MRKLLHSRDGPARNCPPKRSGTAPHTALHKESSANILGVTLLPITHAEIFTSRVGTQPLSTRIQPALAHSVFKICLATGGNGLRRSLARSPASHLFPSIRA